VILEQQAQQAQIDQISKSVPDLAQINCAGAGKFQRLVPELKIEVNAEGIL
jgi:hypothetical protein